MVKGTYIKDKKMMKLFLQIIISRPRLFGKFMAAEMLVAYCDKSCDSREISYSKKNKHMMEKYAAEYFFH